MKSQNSLPTSFDPILMAPCGMNCGVCMGYLRQKNHCPGCRYKSANKLESRVNCTILNCAHLAETESKFCYECSKYPCRRLMQLEKRYVTKYKTSLAENLQKIKTGGLTAFAESEYEKWLCRQCGGTVCIHKGYCWNCGK
jgi:hypothetical protein